MQVGLSGPSALTYGTPQETGRAELCTHLGVAGPTMQQLLGRECVDTQVHTAHTRAHGAHTLTLSLFCTYTYVDTLNPLLCGKYTIAKESYTSLHVSHRWSQTSGSWELTPRAVLFGFPSAYCLSFCVAFNGFEYGAGTFITTEWIP